MPTRNDILRSYRELLYVIKRLPNESSQAALTEARHKMRENLAVAEEAKVSELHKLLVSKIGFLRLSQPRRARDRYAKAGTFVMRDGKLTEQSAERESRAMKEPMSTEEGLRKHNQLLKRQYFGQKPPPFRPPF